MNSYMWETPDEIMLQLAQRIRRIRRRRKISQLQLSHSSGVSYGSIKRFESTGQISLLALTRIAIALHCADEIRHLFESVPYESIEEVARENR